MSFGRLHLSGIPLCPLQFIQLRDRGNSNCNEYFTSIYTFKRLNGQMPTTFITYLLNIATLSNNMHSVGPILADP